MDWEGYWRDIVLALRRLLRRPLWTLNAASVLALGLGASITLYSVVYAVLLRPLPFTDAEGVVKLLPVHRQTDTFSTVSYRSFVHWRDNLGSVDNLAVYRSRLKVLGDSQAPERGSAAEVSPEFFRVLGVQPFRGRLLEAEDFSPGAAPTVIVDRELWQRRFAGSEDILGRQILLDGEPTTVIGVIDRQYRDPRADLFGWKSLWVPLQVDEATEVEAGSYGFGVVARLAEGTPLEALTTELDQLAHQLEALYPDTHRGKGATARTAPDLLLADAEASLHVLMAAVVLLLLIACSNVAHLFLARAPRRRRQATLCRALGASYWQVLRQLWSESLLVSLLGAAGGFLLAVWAVEWIPLVAPSGTPRLEHLAIDLPVLWGALGLTVATAVLSSLAPALGLRRIRGEESLKPRSGGTPRRHGLRQLLVIGEVALSLVLILATGLMLRSLWELRSVDPGFDTEDLLVVRIDLPPLQFPEVEGRTAAARRLEVALRGLPEVEAAGLLFQEPPISETPSIFRYWLEGSPPPAGHRFTAGWFVSGGYRQAMGIPLIAGRWFTDDETVDNSTHLVINQSLGEEVWPGQNPVGRHLMSGTAEAPVRHEIIGVVADLAHAGVGVEPTLPMEMYAPWGSIGRHLTAMVRAPDSEALRAMVMATLAEEVPGAPVLGVVSGDVLLAESLAQQRFITQLLSVFAVLALLLAAAGLYGVLSYQVSERRQEIGLRMALGARAQQMARMITLSGLRSVSLGLIVGVVLSLAIRKPLETHLFGVEFGDVTTYAAVFGLLWGVAWLASWAPARRAARTDPSNMLRWE